MYSFEEKVFIVWGGNKPLADKVAKRLSDKGTITQVGGDVSGENDTYYLGPNVIRQMDECSRAIILAQPEMDAGGRYKFRENLMFEWGYLLNRLPPGAIAVYIVGADRSSLPADLQGAYASVVPAAHISISAQSAWISSHYRKTVPPLDGFSVFDMLLNWDHWKSFIDRQIDGSAAPRPKLFRRVLANMFLPALYADDLDYCRSVLSRIDHRGDVDTEYLIVGREFVEYFQTTRKIGTKFQRGQFQGMKIKVSNLAGHHDGYLVALVRHLMGLCLMNEAFIAKEAGDQVERLRLLGYAITHLQHAVEQFENADIDPRTAEIWLGYTLNTLGKCLFERGELRECENLLQQSIHHRTNTQRGLASARAQRIYENYLAESFIHIMRFRTVVKVHDDEALRETLAEIDAMRDQVGGHVWRLMERELQRLRPEPP
jgi:hypothetical protein